MLMWHESMIISKAKLDMQMSAQMGISTIWDLVGGFCFRDLPARMKGETWSEVLSGALELATCCLDLASEPPPGPPNLGHPRLVRVLRGVLMNLFWPTSLSLWSV